MSLQKAGIKLSLDGKNEFLSGLKSINSEMKLMEQQAKTAVAAMGNNASFTDKHKAKMKALGAEYDSNGNKIKLFSDRLKTLPKAQDEISKSLEKSKKAFSDSANNTKKLEAEYKRLKSSSKASKKEINAANDAYKASKAETKALKTEVNSLTQAYNANEKELEDLPLKLSKAEEASYKLRNEMQQQHTLYRNAGGQYKELADGMQNFGQGMVNTGKKITKFGAMYTAGVTLPIVAGFKSVINTSANFEQSMSKVKAVTQATDSDFANLRETAKTLGATTMYSAGEVANTMIEMGKAGFDATQIIASMPGVLDAAAASGEDLAGVSVAIVDALTGFGLEAKEAGRVADVMTQAANGGTIGFNDLAESFKYVGPLAKTMGFSIEEVSTALLALSKSNIKGSQAGNALKNTFLRLASPTKKVAQAMSDLGITIADEEGNFKSMNTILSEMRQKFKELTPEQQTMYAEMIAGKEAVPGLLALLKMSQEEYDGLSKSMENAQGVAKKTADVMKDNFAGQWEEFGGAIETLKIELGEQLLPALKDITKEATKYVEGFGKMDDSTKQFYIKAALATAAAGPLLTTLGLITQGAGSAVKGMGWLTRKIGKFKVPKALNMGGEIATVGGLFGKLGGQVAGFFGSIGPWGIVAAAAAYFAGRAIYDNLNEPQIAHKKAVDETNGAYQDWFDGITKGAAEARASIEEVKKATEEAKKEAMEKNVHTQRQQEGLFAKKWNGQWEDRTVTADFYEDSIDIKVANMGYTLEQMGHTPKEIEEIQASFEHYSTMLAGSFSQIKEHFQDNQVVTQDWAVAQKGAVKDVVDTVKKKLHERTQAELDALEKKKSENVITEQQYARERKLIEDHYNETTSKIDAAQKNINTILEIASQKNRELTQDEVVELLKNYDTLATESGKSLSKIPEAMEAIGNNLRFMTDAAGLDFLHMAGIIDDSVIQSVQNAPTAADKVKILEEAWAKYNNIDPKEKETKVRVFGEEKLKEIVNKISDWDQLYPEEKKAVIDADGGEELENAIRELKHWDQVTIEDKHLILETQPAIAALEGLFMKSGAWNDMDFVEQLIEIDTTADTAEEEIVRLYNTWAEANGKPKITVEAGTLGVKETEYEIGGLNNLIDMTGDEPIEISATAHGVYETTSEVSGLKDTTDGVSDKTVKFTSSIFEVGANTLLIGAYAAAQGAVKESVSSKVEADAEGVSDAASDIKDYSSEADSMPKEPTSHVKLDTPDIAAKAREIAQYNTDSGEMKDTTATATTSTPNMTTNTDNVSDYNKKSGEMKDTKATATTTTPNMTTNTGNVQQWNTDTGSMTDETSTASTYTPNIGSNIAQVAAWLGKLGSVYNTSSYLDTYIRTFHQDYYTSHAYAKGGHIDMFKDGGNLRWGGEFAGGTSNVPRGYAGIVGEAGPEIFKVTKTGVSITPLSSREKMRGLQGVLEDYAGTKNESSINLNVTINHPVVKENADIKNLAKEIGHEISREMKREKKMLKGEAVGFA